MVGLKSQKVFLLTEKEPSLCPSWIWTDITPTLHQMLIVLGMLYIYIWTVLMQQLRVEQSKHLSVFRETCASCSVESASHSLAVYWYPPLPINPEGPPKKLKGYWVQLIRIHLRKGESLQTCRKKDAQILQLLLGDYIQHTDKSPKVDNGPNQQECSDYQWLISSQHFQSLLIIQTRCPKIKYDSEIGEWICFMT